MISKSSYNLSISYKIHYLYENKIIIILLSEQITDAKAFAFLDEMKDEILKKCLKKSI